MTTKRTVWTVLALIALLTLAIEPVIAAPAHTYSYTVKKGETLGSISRKFGVSLDRLIDINNLGTRPDIIYVGQTLTIPIDIGYTPSYVSPFFYVVQAGDTVQSLYAKFAIDPYALRQANGLAANANAFTAGATLLIPAGPHRYSVKAGDTLQSIATLFGTTVNALLRTNTRLNKDTTLKPGQEVYIPILYNAAISTDASTPVATTASETSGTSATSAPAASVGNPTTGLKPTDSAAVAEAANKNVVSGVGTITMPQNVVNLNGDLTIRWVQIRNVRRDPTREHGAIVTAAIQFRGGTGTVTIESWVPDRGGHARRGLPVRGIYVNANDIELWNDIEVEFAATCGSKEGLMEFYFISGQEKVVQFHPEVICP